MHRKNTFCCFSKIVLSSKLRNTDRHRRPHRPLYLDASTGCDLLDVHTTTAAAVLLLTGPHDACVRIAPNLQKFQVGNWMRKVGNWWRIPSTCLTTIEPPPGVTAWVPTVEIIRILPPIATVAQVFKATTCKFKLIVLLYYYEFCGGK